MPARLVYQALGVIAAVNQRLARMRINFVPLNLAVVALLCVGLSMGWSSLQEARSNPIEPARVSVDQLLAGGTTGYVTVEGMVDATVVLETGKKGTNGKLSRVDAKYAPMLAEAGGRAILVQLPATWGAFARARMTVTGMLRPIPDVVRRTLENDKGELKTDVNRQHVLIEGAQPSTLGFGLVMTTISGFALLVCASVALRRGVIFRPESNNLLTRPVSDRSPVDLRVSGRFTLNARTNRRFIEVPASLSRSAEGNLQVQSNIDASSSFMGMRTADRNGTWTITVPADSLSTSVDGRMFFGLQARPALRFRMPGKRFGTRQVFLSFENEAQRQLVREHLEYHFGRLRPAAA